jgi:uncharacterized membrane protein
MPFIMESVSNYFKAEKKDSVFFIAIGFLTCLLSFFYLFIKKEPYYNGISYAFISIGLIQLVVGISIYLRSDIDNVRVNYCIQKDIIAIKKEEIPRMKKVMFNLVIYRWVEISLIIISMFLLFYFASKSIGKGLGLGLLIQSSIMLLLDYFAEQRGKIYLDFLTSLF